MIRLQILEARHKLPERFWFWLAWKLPRRMVYFCVIRAWAAASTGIWSSVEAPAVTVDEALARWEAVTKGKAPDPERSGRKG